MIVRIWHGWTTPENAPEYERLVTEEVVPGIADMAGEGYEGYELARREHDGDRIEYVTLTRFASWEALRRFTGDDYEEAHVPPKARELLADFDEQALHYEIRDGESN